MLSDFGLFYFIKTAVLHGYFGRYLGKLTKK